MNLVTQLKRVIGVEVPSIEVRDVCHPVRSGGELRATVWLGACAREARLDAIKVRFVEERLIYSAPTTSQFDFWQKVGGFSLPMSGRVLSPGESLSLPITLRLPDALAPSETHRRYRLSAKLGALGPSHGVVVTVA